MILEQVSVYSKSDLSELEYLLRKKVPANHFIFLHNNNNLDYFSVDICYEKTFLSIISIWLNKILSRKAIEEVLNKNSGLSANEYIDLCNIITEKLKSEKSYLCTLIKKDLTNFFKNKENVNIDGFTRFSLQDYKTELNSYVYKYFDEYFIEKNYNDFINLLKFFIETEEAQLGPLHVETQKDGSYKFFDNQMNEITDECLNALKKEFYNEIEEYDDILISTLILLLPSEIFLYRCNLIKNKNFFSSLKRIFNNRLKTSTEPLFKK